MNKIDVRIEKIKNDHEKLLKMVNDSILENKNDFVDEIDQVANILKCDSKNIAKYESIKNAQELIVSLTQKITEAKSVDEIMNIRKKLNYYISKIKSELKKRGVEQSTIDSYQEKSNYLRKNIAKYICFLKRKDNIVEIERLNSNYENLTTDEMEQLKKYLKREMNYNTRNINSSKKNQKIEEINPEFIKEDIKPTDEKDELIEYLYRKLDEIKLAREKSKSREIAFDSYNNDTTINNENVTQIDSVLEETADTLSTSSKHGDSEIVIDNENSVVVNNESVSDVEPVLEEFKDNCNINSSDEFKKNVENIISFFSCRYEVTKIYDYYENSRGRNTINFLRNIPRYIHNKKSLKLIEKDYFMYYRGIDLTIFMEYVKRINSIRQGLKCIFNRSYLYNGETKCLNSHEKCCWLLFNFCKNNSMNLSIENQLSLSKIK